jgi:hypothetical protein
MSVSSTTETNNGHKINLELKGKVMANVKKLADVEGGIGASDSIYLNLERKLEKKEVRYPDDFLATHNGIIQILCDIEKQLQDSTLSRDFKNRILEEKLKYRSDYFNFLLNGEKPTSSNQTPIESPTGSTPIKTSISNPAPQSSSTTQPKKTITSYFDENSKTEVAILATSAFAKGNFSLNSILSDYFAGKGLKNNPIFFRSNFISSFGDHLRDSDISIFHQLDIRNNANCVCFVNQEDPKLIFEDQEYEGSKFKKASTAFSVVMFYLNGSSSPQAFQIQGSGAGVNETLAQESLHDNFRTSLNNLNLNLDLCKK